jgi:pimeloyl-ACP methyl ester carboxylesterase
MADHAADVVAVIDALGVHNPVLVGHSFGGMLSFFLAAQRPERFARIVVLDAAISLAQPAVREMLGPMLARLGVVAPSWDAYLSAVKALPYLRDAWDPAIERFFRAYVQIDRDGRVQQLVNPVAILAAVEGVLAEDWQAIVRSVRQPLLVINARDPYGPPGSPVFLPPEQALATVEALPKGIYRQVSGNHFTMVFGGHAREVATAIRDFVEPRTNGATDAQERE